MLAVKDKSDSVSTDHFMRAIEVITVGQRDSGRSLGEKTRRIVAVHEAGHAICVAALGRAEIVERVSIIPTTKDILGYNLNASGKTEEEEIKTSRQILDEIVLLLGGRAAEQAVFGDVSTGTANDLERAVKLAYRMIAVYGLGKDLRDIVFLEDADIVWFDLMRHRIESELVGQMEESYKVVCAIV